MSNSIAMILKNEKRDKQIARDKELRKISPKVCLAKSKGEKFCKIKGKVSEDVAKEIEKYGYQTERPYGCTYTTISWK